MKMGKGRKPTAAQPKWSSTKGLKIKVLKSLLTCFFRKLGRKKGRLKAVYVLVASFTLPC